MLTSVLLTDEKLAPQMHCDGGEKLRPELLSTFFCIYSFEVAMLLYVLDMLFFPQCYIVVRIFSVLQLLE